MYKDKSCSVDDINEEVELIAEVGFIALRVRNLEKKLWGSLDLSPTDGQPKLLKSPFETTLSATDDEREGHSSTSSYRDNPDVGQLDDVSVDPAGISNDEDYDDAVFERATLISAKNNKNIINNNTVDEKREDYENELEVRRKRKKLLEDFLIQFYEDHRRAKSQLTKRDIMNSGSGQGAVENTNNSFSSSKPNDENDGDNSQTGGSERKPSSSEAADSTTNVGDINVGSDQSTGDENRDGNVVASAQSEILSTSSVAATPSSDQISQRTLEIAGDTTDVRGEDAVAESASGSGIVTGGAGVAISGSARGGRDSGIESAGASSTTTNSANIFNTSFSGNVIDISENNFDENDANRAIGEDSLVQLKNTLRNCQFDDEDLRSIITDLKRKIEYTERMNWLSGIAAGVSKRPMGPPHRKSSLPKHTEVKKRFLEICDNTLSDDVKAALRLPAFDSYDWEDADVIHLMQTMFMELGLIEKFNIPIATLREWLYEVYKHYNQVPFHNFRHCFCVAQMMYAISRQASLIARLGELEVLILLVSCICHDLDHPGYNNIYQINARTELALRYNDISPLENHHCSIAFRLLENPDFNIFKNFNRDQFNEIREGIIRCILATDMARHNEILTQFKEVVPTFDYSNRAHVNLLCMVLIKVADISNEARPMDVAEPWLDRLLQEFFAQSAAEKSEGLPVTPFMDPDKVSKPGSQVRFIGLVLLPLFEALGELLPEIIDMIIIPVRVALDYYKRLNDAQTKTRKSLADATENSSDGGGSGSPQLPRSQSGISVRSRRSIPSQKSTSRTSVDEPTCIAAELHDLPEGSESGDSETATEVDVAEKTSKFKVDTEGSNRSKSSHSTSRKSSREKRPSMISEMCSAGGRIRNSYGNIHGYHANRGHFSSNRAVSLDQYSNNRRSSDGLQQVISDSNVFYNRHNRSSLDNEGQANVSKKGAVNTGEDVLNMNMAGHFYDGSENRPMNPQLINNKNLVNSSSNGGSGGGVGSGGGCSHNGTKTWKARFKQITEIFSFSFDKGAKRYGSTRSSPCSIRNNNAADPQKPGICCTISNNLSPSLKHKQELMNAAGRNRAYSLDVPPRHRYSSSSGGDSRKSSRNEENSNKHDLLNEDNNSNHTSSGEVPPPLITIGGAGGTEGTIIQQSQITGSKSGASSPRFGYSSSAVSPAGCGPGAGGITGGALPFMSSSGSGGGGSGIDGPKI